MQRLSITDAQTAFLQDMLPRVRFFAPLTPGQMAHLLPCIQAQGYDYGETVLRQGDAGDAFYVIFRGSVDVQVKGEGFWASTRTVARMLMGDFFGEMALVNDEPRTASVVCVEPTVLLVLQAADFRFVLELNFQVKDLILQAALQRRAPD